MTLATTTATPADRLFDSAMEQIDNGDLRQASGTLWEASTAAFRALAKRRGWVINKHRRYHDVYSNARPELPGDTLFHGFAAAVVLERNWVENYELSEWWVRCSADQVREMIDALQSI